MSEEKEKVERRKHPRVKANFIVIYRPNKPLNIFITVDKREISALMWDLSVGGMAIVTEHKIPVKTSISINFTLINTAAALEDDRVSVLDVIGVVCHGRSESPGEHRLGIEFTRVTNEEKQVIEDFVIAAKGSFGTKSFDS